MEAMSNVEKEVDKVISKFEHFEKFWETILGGLVLSLEYLYENYDESASKKEEIMKYMKDIKASLNQISSEHKELHASVSKVGKSLDKNFVWDYSSVYVKGAFKNENCEQIDEVVRDHLLQTGMLDVADTLAEESGLLMDESAKAPFKQLHHVLSALKKHDLEPALQWVDEHREGLAGIDSCMEFKLHRLYYIGLLRKGFEAQKEALEYSKRLVPFAHKFPEDFSALMGALAFLNYGLERSPYSGFLGDCMWTEVLEVFMREACLLLGLPFDTPLYTVIQAGCRALQPLMTLKQAMQDRQCSVIWNVRDELPIEIDLGPDSSFHSIFACPILRQQTNDSNPPLRLVCGHVISKDAFNKLISAEKWLQVNPSAQKIKCPYCPMEQARSDGKEIHF